MGAQPADGGPCGGGAPGTRSPWAGGMTAPAADVVSLVGRRRPVLITGGAGFIGCQLADRLASQGEPVLIFDSLARPGVEANLAWLKDRHPGLVSAAIADIRDADAVR